DITWMSNLSVWTAIDHAVLLIFLDSDGGLEMRVLSHGPSQEQQRRNHQDHTQLLRPGGQQRPAVSPCVQSAYDQDRHENKLKHDHENAIPERRARSCSHAASNQ